MRQGVKIVHYMWLTKKMSVKNTVIPISYTNSDIQNLGPSPQLECWNIGIMDSGMVQCWTNGPPASGIDDKIKMVNILLNTHIPSFSPRRRRYPTSRRPQFHYSISGANSESPKKTSILSVGCRNFETLTT
jgi:hypothetical protein